MDRIFFIDLDGNIIENNDYESHIGLAMYIVENDEKLKEQFINSNNKREDLFLINNIGYIEGASNEYNKFLIINKEKTTAKQKNEAWKLIQSGYTYEFSSDENTKSRF